MPFANVTLGRSNILIRKRLGSSPDLWQNPPAGRAQHQEAVMPMYMLLCNFTEQGVRNIKDAPKRRAAGREAAKKIGVEVKTSYLAMGTYDLIIHLEAKDEETLARYVLSLASAGNLRTTTVPIMSEAQFDKIVGSLA